MSALESWGGQVHQAVSRSPRSVVRGGAVVFALPQYRLAPVAARALHLVPVVLTLGVLVIVVAFIAWSYVAQPEHPDGVCYESRGRPMPCVELERRRAVPP